MLHIVYILIGLVFLILGGNWLLKSAVSLSLQLNIPKVVIGMTVVSFATSAPELIVSIRAALDGSPDLALANVVGSNIANLGLVLGITVLLGNIDVRKSFYTTDWPILIFASLVFFGFIYFDGVIEFYEGLIMVILLVAYILFLLKFQKTAVEDEVPNDDDSLSTKKTILFLILGGLGLWGGSELLINGATGLARYYEVSERVIGVTILSIGTSIPELAASVIAVMKKEKAISLGNLIGSNIFNVFAVLGITSMITPLRVVDNTLLSNDILWMLGFAFILLPLVFIPKGLRLGRRDGLVLLAGYIAFVYFTMPN